MRPEQIKELVRKYLDGSSTENERELLNEWFRKEQIDTKEWEADTLDEQAAVKAEIFVYINENIDPKPIQKVHTLWPKITAAASIIFMIGVASYFLSHQKVPQPYTANLIKHDALPGSNGAILTLANGKQVILGKNNPGQSVLRNNKQINSYSDSLLIYNGPSAGITQVTAYNTLTTPYGRQFNVILPDGTKVWLNAASTLQYPTVFSGSERLVKLTGEAYFEVVHNGKMPFKVISDNEVVEDIGTAFNVNTYNDESKIVVTLVEGSAKISKNNNAEILKPGQQASINSDNNKIVVAAADIESALAWKNGLFHFNHAKVDVVLKQMARWYDLKIEYVGAIPDKTIDGEIYRNVNASQVFSILSELKLNFKIEGNKLIVLNQFK